MFVLPLVANIELEDPKAIQVLLTIMLVAQIYITFFELLEIASTSFVDYFSDFYNCFDFLGMIIFTIYYIQRISKPQFPGVPPLDNLGDHPHNVTRIPGYTQPDVPEEDLVQYTFLITVLNFG